MRIIGIDIGSYSIKIAEVVPTSSGGDLVNYSEYKLNTDPNADRHLETIDVLRNYVASHDPHETHFIVALKQSWVTHRRLNFPFKERHSIQKSLAFELEDDIPLNFDNGIFDAKVVSFDKSSSNVLASATSKENVKEALQLCRDAGFEPHMISCDGLAFANIFENWQAPPKDLVPDVESDEEIESSQNSNQPASMLLHVGYEESFFLIYLQNELYTVHSIGWGSRHIAQAIANKYNIPLSEGVKELHNKGFILLSNEGATQDQITFSDTIKGELKSLCHKLKLAFIDVESEYHLKISKCSISGSLFSVKNVGAHITQTLEVACNPASLPINFINNHAASYSTTTGGVALGLAIEGLKRPRNPATNFLKGDFAKKNKALKVFWDKWSYTAKIAAASFAVLLVYGIIRESFSIDMVDQARDNLKTHSVRITGLKKRKASSTREINKYIKKQENKAKNAKSIEQLNKISSVLDVVKEISSTAPGSKDITLDVRTLNVENEQVYIEGLIGASQSIKRLETALKSVSSNKKLSPLRSSLREAGKKSFAYKFNVQRIEGL